MPRRWRSRRSALPVASLGDVLTTKLMALNEQDPDLSSVLELARSLREQIDWDFVRSRTAGSPFARAFFTLVEELGIVELEELEVLAEHVHGDVAHRHRAELAREGAAMRVPVQDEVRPVGADRLRQP